VTRAIRIPRVVRPRVGRGLGRDAWPLPRRIRGSPGGDAARSLDGVPVVRGRLVHVSVVASMRAGAWAGLVLGFLLGAPLGALIAWLAGAIVGWQRDLSFTLGIARSLLPFGDQIGVLRTLSTSWLVVVPGVAIGSAIVGAVILAFVGGILAAAYNATGGHASIVVELAPEDSSDAAASPEGRDEDERRGRVA
jgi:hypothetical protein